MLEEFVGTQTGEGHDCRMLTPAETLAQAPAARPDGLRGAMFSNTECQISSPLALTILARHLVDRLGVAIHWRHAVTAVETGHLVAGGARWAARRIVVCPGAELDTLFPGLLHEAGLRPVRLQMLAARTGTPFDLGPALCAGLTLLHYPAFEGCRTLPALRARLEHECDDALADGIHILLSQHEGGELIIGDSHDYGPDVTPFNSEPVDQRILHYLAEMTLLPPLRITRRWQGVYVSSHHGPATRLDPCDRVTVLTGLGGAGMTFSFGVTARLLQEVADV
ncbi:FAD-dependent oxidoreductase [Acidiphilium sp.]|uniref:FAD-dependent oxidoreductase n=1 Tax=Acidiphilium sp. TaxID=527 RepID=UPI002586940D|nr:FAD-dependent oxidoreductase [Acidiphilium sp.]